MSLLSVIDAGRKHSIIPDCSFCTHFSTFKCLRQRAYNIARRLYYEAPLVFCLWMNVSYKIYPCVYRKEFLKYGEERFKMDGINSLQYRRIALKAKKLYTWICVSIDPDQVLAVRSHRGMPSVLFVYTLCVHTVYM